MSNKDASDGSAQAIEPARFPLSDKRVYDAYVASRQSAAMAVAVRAGLFDRLHAAPSGLSFDELQALLPWSERGLRSMLSALMAIGLIERGDAESDAEPGKTVARYRCSNDASAYLTRGTPGSLWGLIDMEVDHFLSPAALMAALEKDDSSMYGDADPWEAHEQDPERARAFTAAMHSVSERPAAAFAERIDMSGVETLLDVGGGSGALCIALVRANDALECTVQDMAVICSIAEEYVAAAGFDGRISTQVGDMFKEPLPTGFDAILFSQILHDWGFAKGEQLLRSAFDALAPGGRVLIHEKLVEDSAEAPLANALVHLDMLVWTEGQQYRGEELCEMLLRIGFTGATVTPTTGYWSVVAAVKP